MSHSKQLRVALKALSEIVAMAKMPGTSLDDVVNIAAFALEEIDRIPNADEQTRRLEEHFGGEEIWRQVALQIDVWGRKNLPPRAYEALTTTYDGVMAMHRMMIGSAS